MQHMPKIFFDNNVLRPIINESQGKKVERLHKILAEDGLISPNSKAVNLVYSAVSIFELLGLKYANLDIHCPSVEAGEVLSVESESGVIDKIIDELMQHAELDLLRIENEFRHMMRHRKGSGREYLQIFLNRFLQDKARLKEDMAYAIALDFYYKRRAPILEKDGHTILLAWFLNSLRAGRPVPFLRTALLIKDTLVDLRDIDEDNHKKIDLSDFKKIIQDPEKNVLDCIFTNLATFGDFNGDGYDSVICVTAEKPDTYKRMVWLMKVMVEFGKNIDPEPLLTAPGYIYFVDQHTFALKEKLSVSEVRELT